MLKESRRGRKRSSTRRDTGKKKRRYRILREKKNQRIKSIRGRGMRRRERRNMKWTKILWRRWRKER